MCRKSLLWAAILGTVCLPAHAASSDDFRIGRISYLEGHVSFQHAGDVDWSAATVNLALQPADRLYTGEDGRAEIQFDDGSVLRLAEKTDVEILTLREQVVQLKILLGLATLTVQSSVAFEINTPAAAFTTIRKGVYRFDIHENGETDAIVRKGVLDGANNSFSRRIESGELLHVTAGDKGTATVAQYQQRDEWDEWNDRRNADLVSYESKRYVPSFVTVGVRELDTYGRWVTVDDYGPAWAPYVDTGWTPYWSGRWCYRPIWGWTWVSYEPWGWLPYHYGRWYNTSRFGWCWIPGLSFNFHFWSPGLVRFHYGPGWVSWLPLGPGDYYNTNHYFYNRRYNYYLNDLRLTQRRGPGELANRHVPGAVRTARLDEFTDESFGKGKRVHTVDGAQQPGLRGEIVTDRLQIQPTARSFSPNPDRPGVRPTTSSQLRPVVIRSEPTVQAGPEHRFARITNPSIASPGVSRDRSSASDRVEAIGRDPSSATGRAEPRAAAPDSDDRGGTQNRSGSSIWDRRGGDAGRAYPSPQPEPRRYEGYRRIERGPTGDRNPSQNTSPSRPEGSPTQRYERPAPSPAPRGSDRPRGTERPRPEPTRPSNNYSSSSDYKPRIYRPSFEPRDARIFRGASAERGRSSLESRDVRIFRGESFNSSRGFGDSRVLHSPSAGARPSYDRFPSAGGTFRSIGPNMSRPSFPSRSSQAGFGGHSRAIGGGGMSSRSAPSPGAGRRGPSIVRRRND